MPIPSPSPRQARMLWMSLTALATAIFLVLIVLLFMSVGWVINRLATVLLPLAVAAIVSYLLDPVVDWVEKKYQLSRLWSIVVVFVAVGLLQITFVMTVVPQIVIDATSFIDDVSRPTQVTSAADSPAEQVAADDTASEAESAVTSDVETADESQEEVSFFDRIPMPDFVGRFLTSENKEKLRGVIEDNWKDIVSTILSPVVNGAKRVASLTGFVIGFAMVPVFVFFFLLEEKRIVENWTRFIPITDPKWKEEFIFICRSINDALIVFFRGQVLVAMCLGVLIAIGFSIIGLRYALFLGVLAGVLSIIPYLGVLLSIFPALVIAIVQFKDFLHPLLVILVFVLVQMAEGLLISPKIIGDRVGMHPLTIIIAVLIGTTLMGGIVGGVLAIPLTAALRAIMFRYIWNKEQAPEKKKKRHRKRRGPRTITPAEA